MDSANSKVRSAPAPVSHWTTDASKGTRLQVGEATVVIHRVDRDGSIHIGVIAPRDMPLRNLSPRVVDSISSNVPEYIGDVSPLIDRELGGSQ